MSPRSEDTLRRSSLMRFIPAEHYPRLRGLFTEVRYEFGDPIVRQGDEADAFYVLVNGRARVLKEAEDGTETALNRLVPGDEFGEGALLAGGVRGATVRASTAVEVLRLGREDFLALMEEFPAVCRAPELLSRWRTLHGFLYEFSNFGRLPAPALHALMAAYSPPLAGVFVLTVPLYGALMWFSRRVLRPLFADLEEAHGRYASHQIDAIRGIEAVKAAGAELAFRDAMLAQFLRVSRQQLRGNFTMMAYESALQAVSFGSTVLFLWVGATQVIAGEPTVGAFVAFSSLMAMAGAAILRALGVWDDVQLMSVLLNRLNDIFEHEPEQGRDRSQLPPVRSLDGHIELRQVGFRYGGPESPAILDGISLVIPRGRTCALVGRSGSGKTTLVKLIAGLIEPTAGTILFDHVDSRTLNHRDLRRHIGFVLQENHIFDGTIVRNIAFGDPEPDFDRVLRAAQLANAHEFIQRLPLGYDTKIGETGLALSGGQRQRVAIARALYADPPILIFDEATSALDTESERAIQTNLSQLTEGRTCLVIAHRLSTIRDAHHIVVLEQGHIAETGTHDELMARRGLYFYLSSQQMGLS